MLSVSAVRAQSADDALARGFKTPPDDAKPRTWWHWTNGNVTHEGITKDLEWMKRVGIAGFQLADVASGGGQSIATPIQFGSPQWHAALRHAAAEAQRLGLEMAIFSSPGWSETGGPWVSPAQAMKRLVWTETVIEGPRTFAEKLSQAPANLDFYADARLVAFPLPDEIDVRKGIDVRVECVAAASDGRLLATAHLDGSIRVWGAATGRLVQKYAGARGQGRKLAFSPDGLWLAAGGDDSMVSVREPLTGQTVLQLRGHTGRVFQVAFGGDGRTLLTIPAVRTFQGRRRASPDRGVQHPLSAMPTGGRTGFRARGTARATRSRP